MNKEWNILGLDIGGANTKAVLIKFQEEKIVETYPSIEYFPFWEKTLNDIPLLFSRIINTVIKKNNYSLTDVDKIAVTITAELSDAFQTKREGILTILKALEQNFPIDRLFFITNQSKFFNLNQVKQDPLSVAAANWVSTALFLGKFISKCILIDSGSTTIDVIPILNSKPVAKGHNDITRMQNHELIYTGGLRATIPSITHSVPYKNEMIRISFEKFALISDVHRILGNISEKEYINDTADNRSTSLDNCYARLARIICMDLESITKEELDEIAEYIYFQQIDIVKSEISAFFKSLIKRLPEFKEDPLFILTGLSSPFLVFKVLQELGFKRIKDFETATKVIDFVGSSALAVAGALYYCINKKE